MWAPQAGRRTFQATGTIAAKTWRQSWRPVFGEHSSWQGAAEKGVEKGARGRGKEEEDHASVLGNQRRVSDREQPNQTLVS